MQKQQTETTKCTIPLGWKLVPIEPSEEMLSAYYLAMNTEYGSVLSTHEPTIKGHKVKGRCRYKAMLSAAPEPPNV